MSVDQETIRASALDREQIRVRENLASFTAGVFREVGQLLHVFGHVIGTDRRNGASPFGYGDDTAVAVSMLLQIGSQLVSATSDLTRDGRYCAAAALLRQLVEVEYLAWAFEAKSEEAARWLRSTPKERQSFFAPAKLRAAAGTRFRSVDYGFHCELGGHPAPRSWVLLNDADAVGQLMLSDCLGHSGHVWDHVVRWAKDRMCAELVVPKAGEMSRRYFEWKQQDRLTDFPPPPHMPED